MKPIAVSAVESPVITIRNAAANAKIIVHKLRGNISVLEGSGILHNPSMKKPWSNKHV